MPTNVAADENRLIAPKLTDAGTGLRNDRSFFQETLRWTLMPHN